MPEPTMTPLSTAATEDGMDIITLLKDDHDNLKDLMEKVEKTTTRADKARRDGAARCLAELLPHMRFEEAVLYPAVKERSDQEGKDLTNEAVVEHRVALELLGKLDGLTTDDEMWKAHFTVFKESVEHHIDEEHSDLFPKARKLLSKAELEAMGEAYQRLRATGELAYHAPRPSASA